MKPDIRVVVRLYPSVSGIELGLIRRGCLRASVIFLVAAAFGSPPVAAQTTLPAAPAGRVESGAPSFVVFGPEAIGLTAVPTDLHLLPDGRVVVAAPRELAFGDGVRWETYRAAEGQPLVSRDVAVDRDGAIYLGLQGGFGRVDLGSDGLWRATPAESMPDDPQLRNKTMIWVAAVGPDWYWYSGSGGIVSWRPGQPLRVIANGSTVEKVFQVGGDLFVSDQASGGLYCLTRGGERVTAIEHLTSELVTAAVPFDAKTVLLGTNFSGLRRYDGTTLTRFGEDGALTSGARINDLCAAGDGYFAAALDTLGIVFFDRTGKVVQVLDAKLDHRLARVERLRYSERDHTLWGLLNGGVVRVAFPSRISQFEPLIASGLSYASPYRFHGDLWLLAAGRALRGVYGAAGRLERLDVDQPPGRFVFTLNSVDDTLFACTEMGIYVREASRWKSIAPGIVNARIGIGHTPSGALVYAARGEIGTVARTGDTFTVRRIPHPELGDNYNSRHERDGIVWLELGSSKVARIDTRDPELRMQILGTEAGLFDGWVAIFSFNGTARFQVSNHILRYNAAKSRFEEDDTLLARYPQFISASSRPERSPDGQLWYSYRGRVWTIDLNKPNAAAVPRAIPFTPTEYKFEKDGVVWLTGNRHIQRYDPRVPDLGTPQPRVVITSVQFPNSNRQVFRPTQLPTIPYADNTIVFRFAAPGSPMGSPSTFAVQLEGVSDGWVPTGNTGQAVFNRLKEGHYTLHVRSVVSTGETSEQAAVSFVIAPPWFRTPYAWVAYLVSGIGALAFVIWYPSVRQRRENARLEHLVANRTQQLERQIAETTEKSNALAVSEERYRTLSGELERRVEQRTTELSQSNRELVQRESLFRLIFEHAPVGISWKRVDLDNVHHFNPRYRQVLDLPAETLNDYAVLARLVHPEDAPRQREMNERIARAELDSDRVDLRFVLKSGRLVWASLYVAVVRDQSGAIIQELGILEDITAQKDAERRLAATYKELVDASRMAGMAEVATGVLHNVGNVLNSLNVSSNLIASTVRQSKAESLTRLSALLHEHAHDLETYLAHDPKGRLVPDLLEKLAAAVHAEREWLVTEVGSMQKNIDHIKEIVAMQQSYATVIGVVETLAPESLFEDALRMNSAALTRHDVQVVKDFQPVPRVTVEKGKVLQILTNLIRNAKYACDDAERPEPFPKTITVRLEPGAENRVRFIVRDNGIGIAPENLTRIFAHGFTTRAYGHGFGLHSSALAAREMKGSIWAESEGLGRGASFTLEIPASSESSPGSRRNPDSPSISLGN